MNEKTDAVDKPKPDATTDAVEAAKAQGLDEDVTESNILDIDIIKPDPIPVKIGDKEYGVKPLPIMKMKLVSEFRELYLEMSSPEKAARIVEIVCEILGCPGDENIKERLDNYDVYAIFAAVNKANVMGARPQKKTDLASKSGITQT